MDPFEVLVEEHDQIIRALDVLDALTQQLDRDSAAADLAMMVRFFRRYADDCHHAKEEQILFRELINVGMPAQGGPIAVMLSEHEVGRGLVSRMANAMEDLANEDARRDAQAASREFSLILRSHIEKENQVLYVMGRQFLDPSRDPGILAAYERHEAQALSAEEKAEQLALLASLTLKYNQ